MDCVNTQMRDSAAENREFPMEGEDDVETAAEDGLEDRECSNNNATLEQRAITYDSNDDKADSEIMMKNLKCRSSSFEEGISEEELRFMEKFTQFLDSREINKQKAKQGGGDREFSQEKPTKLKAKTAGMCDNTMLVPEVNTSKVTLYKPAV